MTDQRIFLRVECSTFRSFQKMIPFQTSSLKVIGEPWRRFLLFPLLDYSTRGFSFLFFLRLTRRSTTRSFQMNRCSILARSLLFGISSFKTISGPRLPARAATFFLTGGNRFFFSFCVPSCDNDQWSLGLVEHSGDLARASSARLNPKIRNGDTSGELSIVSFFFPPSSPLRSAWSLR